MPATNFALQNNFNNFNLSSLGGGQQYPPQNYPPMQQSMNQGPPPMQQNFGQQPQQNFGQTPQQNFGQTPGNNQQFENSGMGMNQGMNNNPYGGQGYGQGY